MTVYEESATVAPVARGGQATSVARDDASFDDFVLANGEALQRFAYLVTGNRDDARDAVQDALAGAYRRWASIRPDQVGAYVRRSIVNAHVSAWRKRRRERPSSGDALWDRVTVADAEAAVADADQVARLLGGLTRQQRAAVVLRFYEDRDFDDIARVCGCTQAAARALVRRALSALHVQLTHDAGHPAGEKQ